ncbi:EamA family transporter [uncultured Kordia sp.]|uniref:EamA family transporter n=1 Tax=uncultured Kordia sp. TaxID=507699 RepID=UPI0026390EAE|nr:EamA family transporter [uncultured Kordia sp.]
MKPISSKVLIILAFFAIYIIWGSTYLWNKIAVTELPAFFLASVRFLCASVLIFAIALISGKKIGITKRQLKNSIFVAFLFMVSGNGLFVWALKYVDSGFAALLASTQPLFVLLLMRLIDNKKMKLKSIIGVVFGILGMYLLVSQQELVTDEDTLKGILLIFLCVIGWSYASVFVSKADLPKNHLVSTGYQMGIAFFMLTIVSFSLGEQWTSPFAWSSEVQWSMFLLIILGSLVAFTAFNYLLKQVSTEKVATSSYVNPVVALFLGWWILDEALTTQSLIAASILLVGVYFITSKK